MKLFWDILQSTRDFSKGERMAIAVVIMAVSSVLVMSLLSTRLTRSTPISLIPAVSPSPTTQADAQTASSIGPAAGLAESFRSAASVLPGNSDSVETFYFRTRAFAESAFISAYGTISSVLGTAIDAVSREASILFDKGADYLYETFLK